MRKAVQKKKPASVIGAKARTDIEESVKVNGVVPLFLRGELARRGNEKELVFLEDEMQKNPR